jgi:signal transduction histidine kinase
VAFLSATAERFAAPSRLLVFSLALVSPGAAAQPAAVEAPRTIRVVMDNVYAPFVFRSDDGTVQGILVDQWRAWERKTGIKAEIHVMDWGEALRRMRAGEFDVIDCIVETAERRDYFDFTPAYTMIEASIYFRNDISGISDVASLRGFPLGVKAGDQHIDQLKAAGVTTVIQFPSNEAIIEAAKQRKINVFVVDDPSALYLLNKMGMEADFRHSAPIFRDQLRRAVGKGDAALLRTVSQGFAAIEPGELKRIDEKWFGLTINRIGRYLTYAGYAAAVAILIIAGLLAWNRTLKQGILQRTAALGESERQLHALAGRLMHAQDDERRRIAQMLHETTAQDLAALKMHLARLNRTVTDLGEDDRSALTESIVLADQSMTEIRTLSYLLHPPFLDETGLLSALRWYAAGFTKRSGVEVDLDLPESFERPPLDTETALFRIVQESLINIQRHAGSDTARLRLRCDAKTLVLEIEDRGRGIPNASLEHIVSRGGVVGVGIAGMSERIEQLGGRFEITSSDHGTTVRVQVPLVEDTAA